MVTDAIFTEQNGLKHKVRGINFKKKKNQPQIVVIPLHIFKLEEKKLVISIFNPKCFISFYCPVITLHHIKPFQTRLHLSYALGQTF